MNHDERIEVANALRGVLRQQFDDTMSIVDGVQALTTARDLMLALEAETAADEGGQPP